MVTEEDVRWRLRWNVLRLRAARALTARAAATRGGLSLRLLQRIEAGEANVTTDTLGKLSKALDVDVVELFAAPQR